MAPTVAIETIQTLLDFNFTLSSVYDGFEYSSVTETISFDATDKGALYNLTQKLNVSEKVIPTTIIASTTDSVFESKLIIPLYVIIFLLSVIGNSLVLITLVQNKRMRTVTNVYLLNLVSFVKLRSTYAESVKFANCVLTETEPLNCALT